MKVYKFGGASVRDGEGIRNLTRIVSEESGNLIVIISAFGKTTNALEEVLKTWLRDDKTYKILLENIYNYHKSVIGELFSEKSLSRVTGKIDISFAILKEYLKPGNIRDYDYDYDQVVSYGEIWSTIIVAEYLKLNFADVEWLDVRDSLLTDDRFRDANILWHESTNRTRANFDFEKKRIFVTQGFIGGTVSGQTTTLGREGSDYSAAIIANILDAEKVVVWKDVPGILNADPKWLSDAQTLEHLSYREAVEMTFSGAKVIHPKTIKPLHNKNIPLHVKSFLAPEETGTIIKSGASLKKILPLFVRKEDQRLISIHPKDFSFVMGDNLSMVFHSFMLHGIKVNLVQASAVSINVCVDDEKSKVDTLIKDLESEFSAVYNENVEILSIRHYSPEAVDRITKGREILIEQRTRSTVRFVVRKA